MCRAVLCLSFRSHPLTQLHLKVPTVGVYVMRGSSFVLIIKNGVKRENNSLQSLLSICTREGGSVQTIVLFLYKLGPCPLSKIPM